LVEVLGYKPEGRGFDSQRYVFFLEFFIDMILPAHYDPGNDSGSNVKEYQEYFLGGKGGRYVGLKTLPL